MILTDRMSDTEKTIKKIIHLMQTDTSVDAPADAIKWSKNLFRTKVSEQKKGFARKVLAVLQVDLQPNKAVFGERSASSAQSRQMLFEAGENSIDLRISESEKGFDIKGQILGEGFENTSVKLGKHETKTNELSEFKFEKIPANDYELTLQNADKEIVLKGINLE